MTLLLAFADLRVPMEASSPYVKATTLSAHAPTCGCRIAKTSGEKDRRWQRLRLYCTRLRLFAFAALDGPARSTHSSTCGCRSAKARGEKDRRRQWLRSYCARLRLLLNLVPAAVLVAARRSPACELLRGRAGAAAAADTCIGQSAPAELLKSAALSGRRSISEVLRVSLKSKPFPGTFVNKSEALPGIDSHNDWLSILFTPSRALIRERNYR